MLKSEKLKLEKIEVGDEINELAEKEKRTAAEDEKLEKLKKRHKEITPEIREAAEGEAKEKEKRTGDAERAEFRGLQSRYSLMKVISDRVENRSHEGAEAELHEHYRIGEGFVPLDALAPRAAFRGDVEMRVTAAPDNTGANQQPIIPPVYANTAGAFLGVRMPVVGVGKSVHPVLETLPAPTAAAKDAPVDDTDLTISGALLSAGRLQESATIRREDMADFEGLEDAVRSHLAAGLGEGLDKLIIAEFLAAGVLANAAAVNAESGFADYVKAVTGQVDGRFARQSGDVRMVWGAATFAHASAEFATNTAVSAARYVDEISGGSRVSAHIPAADGEDQQSAVIVRGMEEHATAPVWGAVEVLVDPYKHSDKGQVVVTAFQMYALKVLRVAGFHHVKFQVAA